MKVISGGQTGIDRMGIEVARELGVPTGGTAPKSFRTEDGLDPSLAGFGLLEHPKAAYVPRTRQNLVDSDGRSSTVISNPRAAKQRSTFARKRTNPTSLILPQTS